jgi:oxygen-independent coproporphyrinogen-3 oxidase
VSHDELLVYVHFPWCLEKCPYCDFVSYPTARAAIDHEAYADAVLAELERRAATLPAMRLHSVFFGGGTPSLWEPAQLGRVLGAIRSRFGGGEGVEITVECNPSSLDEARAAGLAEVGVNRLSIGVQSLDDQRLRFLGRLHDGEGALRSVRAALRSGIGRVSADLIYAVADQRPVDAAEEARRLLGEGLRHLSAYNLTIEQGTRFGELARRGRLPLADEGDMVTSFFAVHEVATAAGLGHYEVSNYGAPGDESVHNLGYWGGLPYLGLGCAAVGALPTPEGLTRYRNLPLPPKYLAEARAGALLAPGGLVDQIEPLDPETRLRERIMLGLRLASGFDLEKAASDLGVDPWPPSRQRAAERMIQRGRLVRDGGLLRSPLSSWVFVDGTAAEFF